jgi:hypothetical protein
MTTEDLQQKAVEIITAIENAAVPAAKAGLQLSLKTIQTTAIIDASMAAATAVLLFFAIRFVGKHWTTWWEALEQNENEAIMEVGSIVGGIGSVVATIHIVLTLLDTDTWLSIFAPQLELTRMLLHKVL